MNLEALREIRDPDLRNAIHSYAEALRQFSALTKEPSIHNVFQLLLRRDAVARSLQQATKISLAEQSASLAFINHLDDRLKQQAENIVANGKLESCRQSRQPAETAWWWWLEPYLPEATVHKFDRFDWLWNILSSFCIIVATSFLAATIQAFSIVGGFDILQLFSTLSQATGLVLIAGGTLTDKGHRVVKQILRRFNIPTHFHAEVILAGAVAMLIVAFAVNQSLPLFAQYYYQQGLKAQDNGNLYIAIRHYREAIAFNPSSTAPHTRLGHVYQNLEQFAEAQQEYQDGLLKGDVEAINGLGTLILAVLEDKEEDVEDSGLFSELLDAEVLFRIGLSKVDPSNDRLRSQLHTNLGITLLKRAIAERDPNREQNELVQDSKEDHEILFADARRNLEIALNIEKKLIQNQAETFAGQGIAMCFLAGLDEQEGREDLADQHWQLCEANAYPAAIEQYEDIMRLGGDGVNIKLSTKHILPNRSSQ